MVPWWRRELIWFLKIELTLSDAIFLLHSKNITEEIQINICVLCLEKRCYVMPRLVSVLSQNFLPAILFWTSLTICITCMARIVIRSGEVGKDYVYPIIPARKDPYKIRCSLYKVTKIQSEINETKFQVGLYLNSMSNNHFLEHFINILPAEIW